MTKFIALILLSFATLSVQAGTVLIDFEDVAPQFKDRHGGYTRVIKLGMRKGDGALLSQLEFVGDAVERGKSTAESKGTKAKAAVPETEAAEKKPAKKAPAKKAKKKAAKESSSPKK